MLQPSLLLLRVRVLGRTRGVGEVGGIEGHCWGLGGEVGTFVWLSATHPPLSLLGDPGCLGPGVLGAEGGVGSI